MENQNIQSTKLWRKAFFILGMFLLVAIAVIVLLVLRKRTLSDELNNLQARYDTTSVIVESLRTEAERCNTEVIAAGEGNFAEFEYCKKIVEIVE